MTDLAADVAPSTTRSVPTSSVDWPAIIAGALVAVAVSFVATAFGASIGLTATSPYRGASPSFFYIAVGLWMIFVAVSSFAAGGYLAGRLRRRGEFASQPEVDLRDGVSGLTVWAAAVVLGALLTAATIDAFARSTPGAGGPSNTNASLADRYVDRLLRGEGDAARGAPVPEATRNVVSRLVLASPTGNFASEDRAYLVNVIASQTNFPPGAADERVDAVAANMRSDVDKARKLGIYFGFLTAATLAIGAATAWCAARVGGRHQDQNIDLRTLVKPWR
ncbi:hypothetical protein [Methylosinus sp. Sm6]|uniref:hypothetical protein n=1 Tax=Methylosinus sp. Sm6 TaxID=2866948 RepID=UPI001C9A1E91|nr:hypothetical protein [Methylosinus sp. Sm6]MBY6241626.1 hypothetical protein [Methylosinus sp. Sm6]